MKYYRVEYIIVEAEQTTDTIFGPIPESSKQKEYPPGSWKVTYSNGHQELLEDFVFQKYYREIQ